MIDLDALSGATTVGYVYGGLIANAPHVFFDPAGLSSASGEVFAVVIAKAPEPGGLVLVLVLGFVYAAAPLSRERSKVEI
ncbi:hypothetical protein OAS39_01095 [Pirellulales bacterium]|nr:hypothetical protein [Pirellulales bacterium]